MYILYYIVYNFNYTYIPNLYKSGIYSPELIGVKEILLYDL